MSQCDPGLDWRKTKPVLFFSHRLGNINISAKYFLVPSIGFKDTERI
jgi:hypothetical protein